MIVFKLYVLNTSNKYYISVCSSLNSTHSLVKEAAAQCQKLMAYHVNIAATPMKCT